VVVVARVIIGCILAVVLTLFGLVIYYLVEDHSERHTVAWAVGGFAVRAWRRAARGAGVALGAEAGSVGSARRFF
jgi:hypothetical protein